MSDLEFSKSSLERQRDTLDGELRASQQESAVLKSTVATMTAANAGTKAELEATQVIRFLYQLDNINCVEESYCFCQLVP